MTPPLTRLRLGGATPLNDDLAITPRNCLIPELHFLAGSESAEVVHLPLVRGRVGGELDVDSVFIGVIDEQVYGALLVSDFPRVGIPRFKLFQCIRDALLGVRCLLGSGGGALSRASRLLLRFACLVCFPQ